MNSGDADARKIIDAEHLRLLSVFHFVSAGLALLGVAFASFYLVMIRVFFANPDVWAKSQQGPPPPAVIHLFTWFSAFFVAWFVAAAVGNLLSGLFLRSRRHRIFSMVIAWLNCFHMPIGTTLGVFTLVVLSRDSVRAQYEA